MATHRQIRLVTLCVVLGAHVALVWLLLSSSHLLIKTKSASLQLVWLTRPALSKTAPEPQTKNPRITNAAPRHRADRTPSLPPKAPSTTEESNAIHPVPDWTEELHRAAKDAPAKELAQKRHELDFAHGFPTTPTRPPQFAWNYAATHRIEAVPGGGMLIHINDNCVLILFPLPLVGCAIGKLPVNGDLFEHMHDK